MRKYTEIEVQNILKRKLTGESLRIIAKDYGTSGTSLSGILNRRGISFINRWSEEEEIEFMNLRELGKNNKEISIILNKSHDSVKKKASEFLNMGLIDGKYRKDRYKTGPKIRLELPREELLSIVRRYVSSESCPTPYRSNIIRIFGSWTRALEEAGISGNIGGNFCKNRVTRIYLLKFEGFYKIGITQQQIKSRFAGAPGYEILDYLETDLDNAVYLEKGLKRAVKPLQYIAEHPWFERNGKTECFKSDRIITTLEDLL